MWCLLNCGPIGNWKLLVTNKALVLIERGYVRGVRGAVVVSVSLQLPPLSVISDWTSYNSTICKNRSFIKQLANRYLLPTKFTFLTTQVFQSRQEKAHLITFDLSHNSDSSIHYHIISPPRRTFMRLRKSLPTRQTSHIEQEIGVA